MQVDLLESETVSICANSLDKFKREFFKGIFHKCDRRIFMSNQIRLNLVPRGTSFEVVDYAFIPIVGNCCIETQTSLISRYGPCFSSHYLNFFYNKHGVEKASIILDKGLSFSNRDFIDFNSNFCFVGSTCSSDEEAIRFLLSKNAFGRQYVVVVRNLFDRSPERPFLDSVMFFLDFEKVVVNSLITGSTNNLRRLVQQYRWNETTKNYDLILNDMELVAFLELLNFKIFMTPSEIFLDSNQVLSSIVLDNKFIGTANQKKLIEFYASVCGHGSCDTVEIGDDIVDSVLFVTKKRAIFHDPIDMNSVVIPRVAIPFRPRDDMSTSQTTNDILMISPVGFQSSLETFKDNYFMIKTTSSTSEIEKRALFEFSELHSKLVESGVRVRLYRNERFFNAPDSVFPNNWFSTHSPAENSIKNSSTFITYPMMAVSRRAERRKYIISEMMELYKNYYDLSIFENHGFNGVYLEGTGSLVLDRVNRIAYCAFSKRSHEVVLDEWSKLMGYELVTFHANDKSGNPIYHTNVMLAVCSKIAFVCLDSVNLNEQKKLKDQLSKTHTVVLLDFHQLNNFCANVIEVIGENGRRILLASDRACRAFSKEQMNLIMNNVDEILRSDVQTMEDIGGGGIRCMVGELF